MIIEPNRRRRTRIFRAAAGVVAVTLVGAVVTLGWTIPAPPSVAIAPATPGPSAAPDANSAGATAAAPSPDAVGPTPGPSGAQPSPTPLNGCAPPPSDVVPAKVASHGSRTEKQVALTFDDGNNSRNVLRILRVLTSEHVNATFFPTGRAVELFPDVWRRVANAGYPIANHTYRHRSLAGLCYADQLAELQRARRTFAELGLPMLPVMRPPFEEFDRTTRYAAAAARETQIVLWDVDTFDWTGISPATTVARATSGGRGSIVLMHTDPVNTAYALRRIIHNYRARGYTFVTVGQMVGVGGSIPFP